MEWEQRIRLARKKKAFRREDELKSGSWASCAVGERLGSRLGSEVDAGLLLSHYPALYDEGMAFHRAVEANQVIKARKLLNAINKRIAAIFD